MRGKSEASPAETPPPEKAAASPPPEKAAAAADVEGEGVERPNELVTAAADVAGRRRRDHQLGVLAHRGPGLVDPRAVDRDAARHDQRPGLLAARREAATMQGDVEPDPLRRGAQ